MATKPPNSAESTLRFLSHAGRALTATLDFAATTRAAARLGVPTLADLCAIELIDEHGALTLRSLACRERATARRVRDARTRLRLQVGQETALDAAILTGRHALFDVAGAAQTKPSQYLALFATYAFRQVLIVPLIARKQTIGAMTLTIGSERTFDPGIIALSGELANRAALAIDNARLYAREHRVADTLQRAMLPQTLPHISGQALHAAYLPRAEEANVGGDWYDAFAISDGKFALSIGDVAGHGLEAAVIMGEVRQAFRASALDARAPSEVLTRADRILKFRQDPAMVTAVFGIFDIASSTFTYATAGHPPPILASPGGPVQVLPGDGLPLGLRHNEESTDWTVSIPPGSLLTLYTDGLVEYDRNVIEGERRLLVAIEGEMQRRSADPAAALHETILGKRRQTDDVCILTLSVAPRPVESLDLVFSAIPVAAPLVRQAIRQLANGLCLDHERAFSLQVSVGEAVNNAIEHAYGTATPGTVSVRTEREGDALVTTIEDQGRWRPARREGRGRGLPLMRALMNGVQIQSTQSSTRVRLTMTLPAHQADREA